MSKELFEVIFSLKLAEKKVLKMINSARKEEKRAYNHMINALSDGDRDSAKDYARQLLMSRKQRRALRKYLNKIKSTRIELEKASISGELKRAIISAAKILSKTVNDLDGLRVDAALSKIREIGEITGTLEEETLDEVVGSEKIDEILKQAEIASVEKVKELLPELPEELEEEDEELEDTGEIESEEKS
ncbi:MAG: hypothetical protein J7K59_04690 [Candidatus Korarchaeota archaeon]|nr:hypothetical protein [Candidatus Korarchaeota archaeon]